MFYAFSSQWIVSQYEFHAQQYLRRSLPHQKGSAQSTLAAISGLVTYVNSQMDTEAGLPAEGLPTLRALVRLLSRVDSQV